MAISLQYVVKILVIWMSLMYNHQWCEGNKNEQSIGWNFITNVYCSEYAYWAAFV